MAVPARRLGAIFLCGRAARIYEPMSESGKAVQRAVRQRRLSAALRENLKRRKAQARERDAAPPEAEKSDPPHDSAGIGAEKPNQPLRGSSGAGKG
jgi:hypothetical protein